MMSKLLLSLLVSVLSFQGLNAADSLKTKTLLEKGDSASNYISRFGSDFQAGGSNSITPLSFPMGSSKHNFNRPINSRTQFIIPADGKYEIDVNISPLVLTSIGSDFLSNSISIQILLDGQTNPRGFLYIAASSVVESGPATGVMQPIALNRLLHLRKGQVLSVVVSTLGSPSTWSIPEVPVSGSGLSNRSISIVKIAD